MCSRFLLLILITAPSLHADPLAGAWETFPSQSNADAWSLFSFEDGSFGPAPWAGPEFDDNPYAFSFFLGGEGVWFSADSFTAEGAFVGDYAAEKISGVEVSVSIDPAELDFIDLAVYADGPQGLGFYYSLIYQPEDLGMMPDWYKLNFSFADNWFSLQEGEAIPFKPDQKFLASIGQVGIRIFPASGVTGESFVGVDDFILIPTVVAPKLSTSLAGGDFILSFTTNPGVSATIEKLTSSFTWSAVMGQSGLTGPQNYRTRISLGGEIFRVVAEEKLTQVLSP